MEEVSFTRPEKGSALEMLDWEIAVARTTFQHAKDDQLRETLLEPETALRLVELLDTTQSGGVRRHLSEALALLCCDKESGLLFTEAGVLKPIVRICKENKDTADLISNCFTVLTNACLSKRNIPKVATAMMGDIIFHLGSNNRLQRLSAARLTNQLFTAGSRVWDMFVRGEGMKSLKSLFDAADDQTANAALSLIKHFSTNERYMFHVRTVVTMDPIVFHSRSWDESVHNLAQEILDDCNYDSVWNNIPTVNTFAKAEIGNAHSKMNANKWVNFEYHHDLRERGEQEGVAAAAAAAVDRGGTYPFLSKYPHEQQQQ